MNTVDAIRIQVVDHHPMLREGLCNLLKHVPDIEVVGQAGEAQQAIRLVEETQPDIVLMDVTMPGLSGADVTRRIRKANPSTSVVILTAYEDDRHILGLLEAGAAGYLLKTSTGQEVIHSLRAVRAGEIVLHPKVAGRVLARAMSAPDPSATEHGLTAREMEVLKLAATGMSNKEIAGDLSLSVPTVKSHLVSTFSKMGVSSRTEAILDALRRGWVSLDEGDPESATV
jgi:DNA-binding NarL/FixJ family response regulator